MVGQDSNSGHRSSLSFSVAKSKISNATQKVKHSVRASQIEFKGLHEIERRRLDSLGTFVDIGPDESTMQLWNLAKTLNPEIKEKGNVHLLGADELEHASLPVRPLLRNLYLIERMRLIFNCSVLVAFFICLSMSLGLFINVQDAFEQDQSINELFFDEEFPGANHKKSFSDIHSTQEFYDWVEGPLLSTIYTVEEHAKHDYVARHFRMIGPLRLRQFRVSKKSCNEGVNRFKDANVEFTCYGRGAQNSLSQVPYGPPGYFGAGFFEDTLNRSRSNHKFHHEGKISMARAVGRSEYSQNWLPTNYGTGGFVILFPSPSSLQPFNKSTNVSAASLVKELISGSWIDKSTRAVFVEFNLYSTETNLLSANQYYCEFFFSGYIQCSMRVRTYPIGYGSKELWEHNGWRRLTMEILTSAIILYKAYAKAKDFYRVYPKIEFFKKWINYLEVFLIFAYSVHRIINWSYTITLVGNIELPLPSKHTFVEAFPTFDALFTSMESACLAFCFCVLLVLNYTQFSRRTAILQTTLAKAFHDLLIFIAVLLVFLFGFAEAAHFVYGPYIPGFMSLWTSFQEMMGFISGGYDYNEMKNVAPYFTGFFYWVWLFLVYLIMINMFIAILTDGYRASRDAADEDNWLSDLPSVLLDGKKLLTVSFYRIKKLVHRHTCLYAIFCFGKQWCTSTTSHNIAGRRQEEFFWETADEKLQHWIYEFEFRRIMGEALHIAEVTQTVVGISNLFRHMLKYYETNKDGKNSNVHISVGKICSFFRQANILQPCDHIDPRYCFARKIIMAYEKCYSVFVLQGHNNEDDFDDSRLGRKAFSVWKTNKYGWSQARTLVVDPENAIIRSFNNGHKLKQVYRLTKLHQINLSKSSKTRLSLTFEAGCYNHCDLVFQTANDRKSFVHRVLSHTLHLQPNIEDDEIENHRASVITLNKHIKRLNVCVQQLATDHQSMYGMIMEIAKSLNIEESKLPQPIFKRKERQFSIVNNYKPVAYTERASVTVSSAPVPKGHQRPRRNTYMQGNGNSKRNLFSNRVVVENMAEMVARSSTRSTAANDHPMEMVQNPVNSHTSKTKLQQFEPKASSRVQPKSRRNTSSILMAQFAPKE